jgi:hypothetical protein
MTSDWTTAWQAAWHKQLPTFRNLIWGTNSIVAKYSTQESAVSAGVCCQDDLVCVGTFGNWVWRSAVWFCAGPIPHPKLCTENLN